MAQKGRYSMNMYCTPDGKEYNTLLGAQASGAQEVCIYTMNNEKVTVWSGTPVFTGRFGNGNPVHSWYYKAWDGYAVGSNPGGRDSAGYDFDGKLACCTSSSWILCGTTPPEYECRLGDWEKVELPHSFRLCAGTASGEEFSPTMIQNRVISWGDMTLIVNPDFTSCIKIPTGKRSAEVSISIDTAEALALHNARRVSGICYDNLSDYRDALDAGYRLIKTAKGGYLLNK